MNYPLQKGKQEHNKERLDQSNIKTQQEKY